MNFQPSNRQNSDLDISTMLHDPRLGATMLTAFGKISRSVIGNLNIGNTPIARRINNNGHYSIKNTSSPLIRLKRASEPMGISERQNRSKALCDYREHSDTLHILGTL